MSQDTGLWSVRRPRETLGSLNSNTGIPQPPSTMKRSSSIQTGAFSGSSQHGRSMSGSRQSLALGSVARPSQPLFGRQSVGPNVADMGSVKRSSFQAGSGGPPNSSGGTMRGGYMAQGGAAGGLSHRASSDGERRSSVYRGRGSGAGAAMGGHQSFFQQGPQTAGVPRDPRPLKDRSYQARIGQELIEYLTHNNFEMEMKYVLSQNFIKSPTQKDFNYIFQWLYHRIDPSYRFQRNIDQEVPPLLKQLRYPYEKSITKSQIAAVGGQNWNTFLGLLHWIMQLAQMLDRYAANMYDDACLEAGVDVTGDHIIFDFLSQAYRDWLAMDEEATDEDADRVLGPHVQSMASAFERSNAKYQQELDILEGENQRLQKEIEDLEKSTPDPAVLDNHFKIMEEDKVKFEEYNQLAMQRSDKYEHRIQVLQEELDKLVEELAEAEEERRGLQKVVDDQGISMQDIDRMTSERERLQKGIESASARLEEAKKRASEKETEASRKLEELEQITDRYNTVAYQIALIPPTAANARGKDYELRVTIDSSTPNLTNSINKSSLSAGGTGSGGYENDRLLVDPVTGYQPAHVLNLDLRGQVKNSFLALRKEVSERRRVAMDGMMQDHDLLDSIKEAMEDKRNEVEALEHRVRFAEEEYEKTKETTNTQRMNSDAQIEKMEKELSKMRTNLTESVQLMEQREMNVNIEHEQLTLRANSMREELHTKITRMLEEVVKFKMHVQMSLEEYEGFVLSEQDKELREIDEQAGAEARGDSEDGDGDIPMGEE